MAIEIGWKSHDSFVLAVVVVLAAMAPGIVGQRIVSPVGTTPFPSRPEPGIQPLAPDMLVPLPPLAVLPMGIATVSDLDYGNRPGDKAFHKARFAYRKKERSWNEILAACQATLALDPMHIEARRLMASALAQQGNFAEAAQALSESVAADYMRWAPGLDSDADIAPLLQSPWGPRVRELVDAYRVEFTRRIKTALLVIAAKGTPKAGKSWMEVDSEIYGVDKEPRPFLRFTHTFGRVVGFLPLPQGQGIAWVATPRLRSGAAIDQINRTPFPGGAAPLSYVEVGTTTFDPPTMSVHPVRFDKLRALGLRVDASAPVATIYDGTGRFDLTPVRSIYVDTATGVKRTAPIAAGAMEVIVSTDEVRLIRPQPPQIFAQWSEVDGDTVGNDVGFGPDRTVISLPSLSLLRDTAVVAPTGDALVIATAAKPCSEVPAERARVLHYIEAHRMDRVLATGELVGQSAFAGSPSAIIYVDSDGGLRTHDLSGGADTLVPGAPGGMGLIVLPHRPLCHELPSLDGGSDDGSAGDWRDPFAGSAGVE